MLLNTSFVELNIMSKLKGLGSSKKRKHESDDYEMMNQKIAWCEREAAKCRERRALYERELAECEEKRRKNEQELYRLIEENRLLSHEAFRSKDSFLARAMYVDVNGNIEANQDVVKALQILIDSVGEILNDN